LSSRGTNFASLAKIRSQWGSNLKITKEILIIGLLLFSATALAKAEEWGDDGPIENGSELKIQEIKVAPEKPNESLNSERLQAPQSKISKSRRLAMAEERIAKRDRLRKSEHHKTAKKIALHKSKSKKSRTIASVHSKVQKTKSKKHSDKSHTTRAYAQLK
jgi:hypothetical protein